MVSQVFSLRCYEDYQVPRDRDNREMSDVPEDDIQFEQNARCV
jgi:hypothetical protein